MSEHTHKKTDEKQQLVRKKSEPDLDRADSPAEAIQRLAAGSAGSGDVLALQQSLGNKAVTNMIQRHSDDILASYYFKVRNRESGEDRWLGVNKE